MNTIYCDFSHKFVKWVDENLKWNNKIFNVDEVTVSYGKIWTPEFALINSADKLIDNYENFNVVILSNGTVRWEPGGNFNSICRSDVRYYPFDTQVCQLIFGAWTYDTSMVNFTFMNETEMITSQYHKNGEWDIYQTKVERNEFFFNNSPHRKFSNLRFQIYIRRKHQFYILNIIIPGILTSIVLLTIFFSPPSQKIHIGVAALLSFRLYNLYVSDQIPHMANNIPLFAVYLTSIMTITIASLIATVVVLNIHDIGNKPMPHWVRILFIVFISRCLCMCHCFVPKSKKTNHLKNNIIFESNLRLKSCKKLLNSDVETKKKIKLFKKMKLNKNKHCVSRRHKRKSLSIQNVDTDQKLFRLMTNSFDTKKLREKDVSYEVKQVNDKIIEEWKIVSLIMDRLFFYIILLLLFITLILFFKPIILQ
ncbi:hypothetical protein A3Q56_06577 [Intoshia linei]|uniref:Neurotransmitter-gated ion-channel ligand-binding domain-containing protein n=1 Tax=Intoshia linei TaxID=1819745 RepID=A0A177AUM0_9BILA|nr:hypothetical protein A3Q56_06577 [Intoshia linei]